MKYRFYKTELGWFIDIKWWPKKYIAHLAMVAGADILLDSLSQGKDEITLYISSKRALHTDYQGYSFCLERKVKLGFLNGAIYEPVHHQHHIKTPIFENKNLLWLCAVTLVVFGRYPKYIFYKVV